jgi:predicted dehydrogenase
LYSPDKPLAGEKAYWGGGHKALLEDFYECAREGRTFWIDGEEALSALLVLKSVYRSSKERRPVEISEWRNDQDA